ncbi:MAG: hypothetical protein LBK82_17545, partial [Planctomycetaceae bacterium]|nr:hypothetical protein [Planctomycetaceae bacterium]
MFTRIYKTIKNTLAPFPPVMISESNLKISGAKTGRSIGLILTLPETDFVSTEIRCNPNNFYSCTALQSPIRNIELLGLHCQIIYFRFNFKETKDNAINFLFETQ